MADIFEKLVEGRRRYSANIQRIIESYNHPFDDSDEIDIRSLRFIHDRGHVKNIMFQSKIIGTCKLAISPKNSHIVLKRDVSYASDQSFHSGEDSAFGSGPASSVQTETHSPKEYEKQDICPQHLQHDKSILCDTVITIESESEPSDAETLLSSTDSDWEDEEEEYITGDAVGSDGSSTNIKQELVLEKEWFFHDHGDVGVSGKRNTIDHPRSPPPPANGQHTASEKIHSQADTPERRHDITYTVDSGCERWFTSQHRVPMSEAGTYLLDNKPVVKLQRSCPEEIAGKHGNVLRGLDEETNTTHVTLLSKDTTPRSSPAPVRRCPLVTMPLPGHSVKDLLAIFSKARPDGKKDSQSDRNTSDTRELTSQRTDTTVTQPSSGQLDGADVCEVFPHHEVTSSSPDTMSTVPALRVSLLGTQELHQEMLPKFGMSSRVNSSSGHAQFPCRFKSTNHAGKNDNSILEGKEANDTSLVSCSSLSTIRSARETVSSDTTPSGFRSLGARKKDITTPSEYRSLGARQYDITTPSVCRSLGATQNDITVRSAEYTNPLMSHARLVNNTSVRPANAKCKVWLSNNFSSWRKMLHSTQSVPAKPVETPIRLKTAMSVQLRCSRTDTETDNMADDECSDTDTTVCRSPQPLCHQGSVNNEVNADVVSLVSEEAQCKPKALNQNLSFRCGTEHAHDATTAVQLTLYRPKPARSHSDIAIDTARSSSSAVHQKYAMSRNKKSASNHLGGSDTDTMPACGKTNDHLSSTLPLRQRPDDSYFMPPTVSHKKPSSGQGNCLLPSRPLSRSDNKKSQGVRPEKDDLLSNTPSGTSFLTAHGENAKRNQQNCNNSTPVRLSTKTGHVVNVSTTDVTPTRTTPGSRRRLDSDPCRTPQASDLFSKLHVNSPRKLSSSRPISPASSEHRAGRSNGATESPSMLFAKLKLLSPSVRLGNENTSVDPDATNSVSVLRNTSIPLLPRETKRLSVSNKPEQHTHGPSAQRPMDVLNGAQYLTHTDSAVPVSLIPRADKPVRHCKMASKTTQKINDAASLTSARRPMVEPDKNIDKAPLEKGMRSLGELRPGVMPPRERDDRVDGKRHADHARATRGISSCSGSCVHEDCAEESRSRRRLGFRDLEERCVPQRSNKQHLDDTPNGNLGTRTMKLSSKSDNQGQQTDVTKTRVISANTTVTEKEMSVSQSETTAAKRTVGDGVALPRKIQRHRVCVTSSPVEDGVVDCDCDQCSVSVIQTVASVPASPVISSSSDNTTRVPVNRPLPAIPISVSNGSSHVIQRSLSRHALLDSDSSDCGSEDTFCTLVSTPTAKQRLSSKVFSDNTSTGKSDSGLDVYEPSDSDNEASASTSSSQRKHSERLHPVFPGGVRAIEWIAGQSATAVEPAERGDGMHNKGGSILAGASQQKEMHQSKPRVVEGATRRRTSYGHTRHLATTNTTNGQSVPRRNSLRKATRHKRARGDSDDDTLRRYHSPVKRANVSCGSTRRTVYKQSEGSRANLVHRQSGVSRSYPVHKQGKANLPIISCPGPGKCTKPFCFSCVTDSF